MSRRTGYETDVSDEEWATLEPLLPKIKQGGHPGKHNRREIINGILYILRSGCQWRLMPHDLPPWKTVYHYFRQWRVDGTWRKAHNKLREKARKSMGKNRKPTAAIIDSQTSKTTEKGGLAVMTRARRFSAESGIC